MALFDGKFREAAIVLKQLPLRIPPKIFLLCICQSCSWNHCMESLWDNLLMTLRAWSLPQRCRQEYGLHWAVWILFLLLQKMKMILNLNLTQPPLDGNSVALFNWLASMRHLWRIFWLETRCNVGNTCLSFKKENSPSLGRVCVCVCVWKCVSVCGTSVETWSLLFYSWFLRYIQVWFHHVVVQLLYGCYAMF